MNKSELIDNYITNNLSSTDKAAFETELSSNLELRQEVEFQKDLISTIQEDARLTLKSRLNNIPVSASSNYKKPLLVAASALLLGTAGTLFYQSGKDNTEPVTTIAQEQTISTPAISKIEPQEKSTEEITVVNSESTPSTNKEEIKVITKVPAENNNTTSNETVQVDYNLQQPEVALDFDDEEQINSNFSSSPESKLNQDLSKDSNKEIIPVIQKSRSQLRKYRYDGENLTLIGNFNEKQPYVLIENNSKLYLLFEDSYFQLKDTKGKASKLNAITDSEIIAELEKK